MRGEEGKRLNVLRMTGWTRQGKVGEGRGGPLGDQRLGGDRSERRLGSGRGNGKGRKGAKMGNEYYMGMGLTPGAGGR